MAIVHSLVRFVSSLTAFAEDVSAASGYRTHGYRYVVCRDAYLGGSPPHFVMRAGSIWGTTAQKDVDRRGLSIQCVSKHCPGC
jgi:hypothetical protein